MQHSHCASCAPNIVHTVEPRGRKSDDSDELVGLSKRCVLSKRRSPASAVVGTSAVSTWARVYKPTHQAVFSLLSREICHAARRSTLNRCDSASDSLSLCPLEIMALLKQVRKCRSSSLHVAACRHLPVTFLMFWYLSGSNTSCCSSHYPC